MEKENLVAPRLARRRLWKSGRPVKSTFAQIPDPWSCFRLDTNQTVLRSPSGVGARAQVANFPWYMTPGTQVGVCD
jgi:hypothetical protein